MSNPESNGSSWPQIEALLHFQGRSWGWLAQRARMSESKLRALRRGRPHHVLHDWQRKLIAEALEVPESMIFGPAADPAEVAADEGDAGGPDA